MSPVTTRSRLRLASTYGRSARRLARTGLLPLSIPPRRLPPEQRAAWSRSYARDAVTQARLALAAHPDASPLSGRRI